ncbi:MAG: Alpha/beta hydrolase family protein [candidate division WS6 bacterium OLB20]|uniref:Alpha/beta hydrolase family protein n=1 Tax=candidate division WS6 bacterium OLB20 TaxID=1617426 RepID=A0A136M0K1_9BACT|nr:MAG: Alpha/beta hydrolase family protein [candidate division WS6 bacterium OLB20]
MRYVLLPGFSPGNREWASSLADAFKQQGIDLEVQKWLHWDDGSENFRVAEETERFLSEYAREDICVFAKSIGTRFVCELLRRQQEKLNISKLVLMGIPALHRNILAGLGKLQPEKVTAIQNSGDPFASASSVADFLAEYPAELIVKESDSHDYPYPDDLIAIAQGVTSRRLTE